MKYKNFAGRSNRHMSNFSFRIISLMHDNPLLPIFRIERVKEKIEKEGRTRAKIEEVCRAYGFHPLSLRLLSGMIVHDMKYGEDIKAWTKYNPLPKLVPKEHNILELAYNSLDKKKKIFISRLSAFRNPMDYDAISIFNDFGSKEKFNEVLLELVDRGMLFWDEKSSKFDLHPIVRKYCYDCLRDKESIHFILRDYFAEIPAPENIKSVDDLAPVIELYHHTVRAGRYDVAMDLFYDRLAKPLYFKFGAYQTEIELLRALFPDGVDKPPRLKNESAQAWTLGALANSYVMSGQPRRAVPLFEKQNRIQEKKGDKKNLAIGLGNLADDQIQIGELDTAGSKLMRAIELYDEIGDRVLRTQEHSNLGIILCYKKDYSNAKKQLNIALKFAKRESTLRVQINC
jgi:tetratricopeptide (TPR) repeat protein